MSAKAARRDVAPQFDVVAIGASAGGVEALHVVAAALPADFPVPVLIVQHMDPRHKSMLAGLLGRRCKLRDRKSTRLNSSHANISYAVFCLKKKKKRARRDPPGPQPALPAVARRETTARVR